nr:GAF domain-containing protein [Caldimonas sp.]
VVGEGRTCFHRSGVSALFPRERGVESFLGLPIVASDGRMLGHLAFFDSRPRGDDMLVDSVFRIFVARAAAEIERIQALARLAVARSAAP